VGLSAKINEETRKKTAGLAAPERSFIDRQLELGLKKV
jgi:hypothetical protein